MTASNSIDWILRAGTEAARMCGFRRSAFNPSIYRGLPIENYIPGIQQTHHTLNMLLRREPFTAKPKLYQLHDAYLMYYQPYDTVINSLKRNVKDPTLWYQIIQQTVKSTDFYKLNKVTSGSQELASLAGARFIHHLLAEIHRQLQNLRWNTDNPVINQFAQQPVGQLLNTNVSRLQQMAQQIASSSGVQNAQQVVQQALNALQQAASSAAKAAIAAAAQDVENYAQLSQEAQESISVIAGSGGHGFSHLGLSILTFLRNPDEYRKRVRILRMTVEMFRKFMQIMPTSLTHQQVVSQFGGISGIDRMLRESQLKDIIPQELAALAVNDPQLQKLLRLNFLLRLSQKQVMVYQRSATLIPVIFVDRSGSMAETFSDANVPKISAAAGLALAIYSKYGGEVYFFDTEVHGPIARRSVVNYLLTVRAYGGTNITEVLEKIAEIGRKDRIYIVVTDGIDEVSSDVIEKLKKLGIAKNVRFILIPPAWEREWLKNFKYVYARDIASFMDAARKMLSS